MAVAYLSAAAGVAVGLVIFAITIFGTRQCQIAATNVGCLVGFFRGIGLSIIAGLIVTSGFAIFIKLGLRYVVGLLAFAAPVLLISQLLSIFGVETRPYVLVLLVAVPAAASELAARLLPAPPDLELAEPEVPALRRAGPR